MDLVRDMGFFLSFFSTGNRRKKSVLTVVIFLMLFFLLSALEFAMDFPLFISFLLFTSYSLRL